MIGKKDIEAAILELGIKDSAICIHSSMKSFGDEVECGAKGIVDAFLNMGCTVMTPTFSYDYMQNPIAKYMPKRNGIDYATAYNPLCNSALIFNQSSKSITTNNMGVLTEYILNLPQSKRGYHPINSFTAIGKYARELIETQTPQKVYAPFQKLIEYDGYVLLMGVLLDRATIIHYAEQLSGRQLFIRWANDENGNIIPIPGGGCSNGFTNFSSLLQAKEILVGQSRFLCYKASELVDVCTQAIIKNPQITHCSNANCICCNDAVSGGAIIDWNG